MTVNHPSDYVHQTVLLEEAVNGLLIEGVRTQAVFVDGTFGRGGHSRRILRGLGESGRLIAFDKDPYAIANAREITDPRFHIVHDSFATMTAALAELARRGNIDYMIKFTL